MDPRIDPQLALFKSSSAPVLCDIPGAYKMALEKSKDLGHVEWLSVNLGMTNYGCEWAALYLPGSMPPFLGFSEKDICLMGRGGADGF